MVVDLSRWQFGVTTVYHFLFVPVTIGMSFLVAGFELAWLLTRNERWLRLARFYGTLFLINFALGLVTGIVQEFQFGMNWSAYSRRVGNIFGAPLAIEALLAFFLESTFLGLWIFGWDRLPAWLHNACMWIVATGTALSAYFILVANSWMQHPVGSRYDAAAGVNVMTSFLAVLVNPAQLASFPHVIAGCFLVGGALVAGVALWQLERGPSRDRPGEQAAFRSALKTGCWTTLVSAAVIVFTGDLLGKLFTQHYQPMKMASAEALYHTATPAPFSLLTIGNLRGTAPVFEITLPRLLSFLATGNWNGTVRGIDNLQAQYVHQYGPGSYIPDVPVVYWNFRLMIGAGMLAGLIALLLLWFARSRYQPAVTGQPAVAQRLAAAQQAGSHAGMPRLLCWGAWVLPFLPLIANAAGWIVAEMGRQPWLVYGELRTADGVSANSAGEVLTSLICFTLLYGVLAVIEGRLMFKYLKSPLPSVPSVPSGPSGPATTAAETIGY